VLAYHGGSTLSELVWLDRSGRQIGTMGTSGSYADVRISPNGREVAVVAADARSGSSDIWIFDRESGIPTRFTSESGGAAVVGRWIAALLPAGRLFRNPGAGFGEPYYDLSSDGQTFNRLIHDAALEPITVVLNWPALIKK
jgi:hypothetical protein